MADMLIHMGTLARPHGIKGEICIDWHADSPLLLDAPLWLQAGDEPPRRVRVLSRREHKGRPLLLLEGVTDRTAAEALRGQKILMSRDSLPPPDEDEAYLEDLLGCEVLLPGGRRLGRLDHVEYPADQEIWVVVTDQDREILFPAQPCFIVGFDLDARTVTIDPPEGLLEVYLGSATE